MDILRKAARLSLAATLLATVGSALSVTGAAALVTVGSAGTMPAGGTSTGMVSFTFDENSFAAFPGGGGTLTVTLADSAGVPTIYFVGQPSISVSPTLGVSITMGPALTSITFNVASSSTSTIEQIVASSVRLGANQPAAAGAVTATLSGSLASAVSATTVLASPGTVGGSGTGTHLAFTTQPGGGTAGNSWTQQPVVAVQNALNAVVTTDNTTVVTLAIGTNPGGGVLTCTGGNSRTVVNGIASFANCAISAGSASPYTLGAFASSSATTTTSAPFLITVVLTQVSLTSATAVGDTRSGFSTSTKVVPVGSQITLRIITNPSLAGQQLGVWIAKRTNGVWSAFSQHASVTVGADGVAYYVYSAGSQAWLSFQARFNGSATIAPARAPARQARWT